MVHKSEEQRAPTQYRRKKEYGGRENLRSLYEVCNDEVVPFRLVNDKFLSKKHKGIETHNGQIVVDLDKFEGSRSDIFTSEGPPSSADDILGSSIAIPVVLPFKDRAEFTDVPLPDSDMLKVLHYYASHRSESLNLGIEKALDDTALLGLGMLVEKWADEMVTDQTASMFIEDYSDEDSYDDSEQDRDGDGPKEVDNGDDNVDSELDILEENGNDDNDNDSYDYNNFSE